MQYSNIHIDNFEALPSNSLSKYHIDDMEAAADRLLVEHKAAAINSEYPAYSEKYLIRRRQKFHETSLEGICEAAGLDIPAPPPAVARLINRALRADMDKKKAFIWALSEMGWSQAKIATALGVGQAAVSRQLERIKIKLRGTIEDHTYSVYHKEVCRHIYHRLPQLPALQEDIQNARAVFEANGYETWILPEYRKSIYVVDCNGKRQRFAFRKIISMARAVQHGDARLDELLNAHPEAAE